MKNIEMGKKVATVQKIRVIGKTTFIVNQHFQDENSLYNAWFNVVSRDYPAVSGMKRP